eukprot:4365849-Alexandrium_andersonii.AAC.1
MCIRDRAPPARAASPRGLPPPGLGNLLTLRAPPLDFPFNSCRVETSCHMQRQTPFRSARGRQARR